MNKKGQLGFMFLIIMMFAVVIIGISSISKTTTEYKYVGKIINMEGGTSRSVLILELDTIGKTPYTTQRDCSNKIRVGQSVYSKKSFFGENNYLWVKYAEGEYC